MNVLKIVLLTIQLSNVLSKKYASSSDESIENLLYFKDCQKKQKPKEQPKPEPMQLRQVSQPQRQFECPFPKMCCSLSCNNECGGDGPVSLFGRQENVAPSPIQPPFPPRQPQLPVQPPMQRGHKRKIKPLLPPIGGRREFGFTKEKIKSLIAKDDDIRKILKDLVRVTMQKVDLVEMINTRRSEMNLEDNRKEVSNSDDDYDLE